MLWSWIWSSPIPKTSRSSSAMREWASYQIRQIASCACAGNAGSVFTRHRLQRKPLVSFPGMHHSTCIAHLPWSMIHVEIANPRWREKRSLHSRRMRNPQFYESGKRATDVYVNFSRVNDTDMEIIHENLNRLVNIHMAFWIENMQL